MINFVALTTVLWFIRTWERSFLFLVIWSLHLKKLLTDLTEIFNIKIIQKHFCKFYSKSSSYETSNIYQKQPPRCSIRKGVLANFVKFTRKHLRQNLFFNKVEGWGLSYKTHPGDCSWSTANFTVRAMFSVIFYEKFTDNFKGSTQYSTV